MRGRNPSSQNLGREVEDSLIEAFHFFLCPFQHIRLSTRVLSFPPSSLFSNVRDQNRVVHFVPGNGILHDLIIVIVISPRFSALLQLTVQHQQVVSD